MKSHFPLFVFLFSLCLSLQSHAQVSGCTDPQSNNYNPAATINDGSCTYSTTNLSLTTKTALSSPLLNESSGLCFINGSLWTFNDSGNSNDIYRIDTASTTVYQTVKISNATNVDWEDMTSSSDYVFVGDFGNNDGERKNLKIYRILKSDLTPTATSVAASIINFSFSDQTTFTPLPNNHNFDCEAMIFLNDSIHLFSKNWADLQTKHYVVPNVPGTHVAQKKETYNTGFLVTGASVQNFGVISLVGYQKTGLLPVSMCLLFDYKNNLLFNGNKRKFSLSSMLTNGQVEGVAFLNNGVGFISNEYISQSGITVTAKLKKFNIAPYLPSRFLGAKPTANFSANSTTVCPGTSVTFTDLCTNSPTSWQWSFPGGNPSSSTQQNPQIQYSSPGTYSVTLIATNSVGSDTHVKTDYITVNSLAAASITASGPTTFCQGGSVTLNAGPGSAYQWKKNTVDISGANGTSYVANQSGAYTCLVTTGCGSALSNSIDVTVNSIPASPAVPSGSKVVCKSSGNNIFSVPALNGASSYSWTVPTGATITSGQGTNSIAVQFSSTAASGNICVYASNNCGNGSATCLAITTVSAVPGTPVSISGNAVNCPGSSGAVFSCPVVANASSYTWTMPANATLTSGQGTNSITVDFLAGFSSGVLKVSAVNCKGTGSARSLTLNGKPGTPGTLLIGPTTGVCPGATNISYSIAAVSFATGYTWTAPANSTIVSGQGTTSVTLNFNSSFSSGTLSVSASNACGSGNARATTIRSTPLTPGTITGPTAVCPNQTGIAYSIAAVAGATTYTWSVPTGAGITAGQTSTSITVNYGTTAGSVKVKSGNACGNSADKTLAISVLTSCRQAVAQEEDHSGLEVFPNPSHSQFTLPRNPKASSDVVLIIRDLAGRKISSFENIKPDADFQFGATFPTGVYVAERIAGNERKFFRLVKE